MAEKKIKVGLVTHLRHSDTLVDIGVWENHDGELKFRVLNSLFKDGTKWFSSTYGASAGFATNLKMWLNLETARLQGASV